MLLETTEKGGIIYEFSTCYAPFRSLHIKHDQEKPDQVMITQVNEIAELTGSHSKR